MADGFVNNSELSRDCIARFVCWSPPVPERSLRTVLPKVGCGRRDRRRGHRRDRRRSRSQARRRVLRVRPSGHITTRTMGTRPVSVARPGHRCEPHATLRRDASARRQQHRGLLLSPGAHGRRRTPAPPHRSTERGLLASLIARPTGFESGIERLTRTVGHAPRAHRCARVTMRYHSRACYFVGTHPTPRSDVRNVERGVRRSRNGEH